MSKKIPDNLKSAICPFKSELEIEVFVKGSMETRVNPSNIKMTMGIITSMGSTDVVYRNWYIEKDKRVETYTTYKGESLEPIYKQLTKEAIMLLEYIKRNCLREDKLLFYMDFDSVKEGLDISSRTTYWKAKKVLIDLGFIAGTSNNGWYWINPKFTFKGVRHKSEDLKDNVIITKKKED